MAPPKNVVNGASPYERLPLTTGKPVAATIYIIAIYDIISITEMLHINKK
jgi:hypothetical protein